jgi:hypothetical protein
MHVQKIVKFDGISLSSMSFFISRLWRYNLGIIRIYVNMNSLQKCEKLRQNDKSEYVCSSVLKYRLRGY